MRFMKITNFPSGTLSLMTKSLLTNEAPSKVFFFSKSFLYFCFLLKKLSPFFFLFWNNKKFQKQEKNRSQLSTRQKIFPFVCFSFLSFHFVLLLFFNRNACFFCFESSCSFEVNYKFSKSIGFPVFSASIANSSNLSNFQPFQEEN